MTAANVLMRNKINKDNRVTFNFLKIFEITYRCDDWLEIREQKQ